VPKFNPFVNFKNLEEFFEQIDKIVIISTYLRRIYGIYDGMPVTFQEIVNYLGQKEFQAPDYNLENFESYNIVSSQDRSLTEFYFFVLNRRQYEDPIE
jgi:hypothetical protein